MKLVYTNSKIIPAPPPSVMACRGGTWFHFRRHFVSRILVRQEGSLEPTHVPFVGFEWYGCPDEDADHRYAVRSPVKGLPDTLWSILLGEPHSRNGYAACSSFR